MITSFFKPKSQKTAASVPSTAAGGPKAAAAITPENPGSIRKRGPSEASDAFFGGKRSKTSHDGPPAEEVEELLSHLVDSNDGANTPEATTTTTWKAAMAKHFASPAFARLAKFVAAQRKSYTVYPPPQDTFSALNGTPLDQVRVVIVGQDPYHGPQQAHGLCFSVRRGVRTPPSLRNIYKELVQDPGVPGFTRVPTHGNLERWAKQGVLMINTVMTVRQGEANSHKKRGWEQVTDEILRAVVRHDRQRRRKLEEEEADGCAPGGATKGGLVFLLWGKPATEKCQTALGGSLRASPHHEIICTSHPSPLGATKTKSPFLGSKCFSRANQALQSFGYEEIDWRVDGDLP